MNDVRFIERKLDGSFDAALGSDSVVPGVTHKTNITKIHGAAVCQARSLRNIHYYEGYKILDKKMVKFSSAEMEYIYGDSTC